MRHDVRLTLQPTFRHKFVEQFPELNAIVSGLAYITSQATEDAPVD